MVITARTGFFVWLLAVVLGVAVPVTCAISRAHPAAPEPCAETLTRVYGGGGAACPVGARMETTNVQPVGDSYPYTIVKCVCPHAAPDGGAR